MLDVIYVSLGILWMVLMFGENEINWINFGKLINFVWRVKLLGVCLNGVFVWIIRFRKFICYMLAFICSTHSEMVVCQFNLIKWNNYFAEPKVLVIYYNLRQLCNLLIIHSLWHCSYSTYTMYIMRAQYKL